MIIFLFLFLNFLGLLLTILYKKNIKSNFLMYFFVFFNVIFIFYTIFRTRLSIPAPYFFIFFIILIFIIFLVSYFILLKIEKHPFEFFTNFYYYNKATFSEPFQLIMTYLYSFDFAKKITRVLIEKFYNFAAEKREFFTRLIIIFPGIFLNVSFFIELLIYDRVFYSLFLLPLRMILISLFKLFYFWCELLTNNKKVILFNKFASEKNLSLEFLDLRLSPKELKIEFPKMKNSYPTFEKMKYYQWRLKQLELTEKIFYFYHKKLRIWYVITIIFSIFVWLVKTYMLFFYLIFFVLF